MQVPAYLGDGSLVDLAALRPEQVDIFEMAHALSKIARYNGINRGIAYSDAQHCVLGARALIDEGEDPVIAAGFLLHDGHEYVFGDWTRPSVALVAHCLGQPSDTSFPLLNGADVLGKAIDAAKASLDAAIFARAALPAPCNWPKARWRIVERMDTRMYQAERLHLFQDAPDGRIRLPKLRGAIRPWGAMKAEEAFLDTYRQLIGEPKRRQT